MTKISTAKFEAIKTAADATADRLSFDQIKALADQLGLSHFTVQEKLWKLESAKPVQLGAIVWESAKAVAIDLEAEFTLDPTIARTQELRSKRVRLFFPKSQVKDGRVPSWLMAAKRNEARATLPSGFDFV